MGDPLPLAHSLLFPGFSSHSRFSRSSLSLCPGRWLFVEKQPCSSVGLGPRIGQNSSRNKRRQRWRFPWVLFPRSSRGTGFLPGLWVPVLPPALQPRDWSHPGQGEERKRERRKSEITLPGEWLVLWLEIEDFSQPLGLMSAVLLCVGPTRGDREVKARGALHNADGLRGLPSLPYGSVLCTKPLAVVPRRHGLCVNRASLPKWCFGLSSSVHRNKSVYVERLSPQYSLMSFLLENKVIFRIGVNGLGDCNECFLVPSSLCQKPNKKPLRWAEKKEHNEKNGCVK